MPPVSIRWSMNQVVAASISGWRRAMAGGARNRLRTRRSAPWRGPSTSAIPWGGIRPRGSPAIPR